MSKNAKFFIGRGLAAGAAGGVVAAVFVRLVTETQIHKALDFEEASQLGLPPGDPALFSRSAQQGGGMLATVLFGLLMGVVLGVTVSALHHRLRGRSEFERGLKVSIGAFVALTLIPALKYPPNPPAVGNPDTIETRTLEYLLLIAASVLVVLLALYLWEWLTSRGWSGPGRYLIGGSGFVLMVSALMLLWPASPDPVVPLTNEATPALVVAGDAPTEVLDRLLSTARATGDESLRDPNDPAEPLDLAALEQPSDLAGTPVAVDTTHLVPHAFSTVIWHFRLFALGSIALMWGVIAGVFGLLADGAPRDPDGPNLGRFAEASSGPT